MGGEDGVGVVCSRTKAPTHEWCVGVGLLDLLAVGVAEDVGVEDKDMARAAVILADDRSGSPDAAFELRDADDAGVRELRAGEGAVLRDPEVPHEDAAYEEAADPTEEHDDREEELEERVAAARAAGRRCQRRRSGDESELRSLSRPHLFDRASREPCGDLWTQGEERADCSTCNRRLSGEWPHRISEEEREECVRCADDATDSQGEDPIGSAPPEHAIDIFVPLLHDMPPFP